MYWYILNLKEFLDLIIGWKVTEMKNVSLQMDGFRQVVEFARWGSVILFTFLKIKEFNLKVQWLTLLENNWGEEEVLLFPR